MNTNSNTYTVVYSAIIVTLVAAILAFVATTLKPKQEANEKGETISQMLAAAKFESKAQLSSMGNTKVLDLYKASVVESYTINSKGAKVKDLNKADAEIITTSELKKQNRFIKNGEEFEVPVYKLNHNGEEVYVLPVYGAGLWGPVWGYIAYKSDLKTIIGAYFDHESETPGLGGKIKETPFQTLFEGKSVDFTDAKPFAIVKGGANGKANAIDAISGATMTSNGVDEAINNWLKAYKPFFAAVPATNNEEE